MCPVCEIPQHSSILPIFLPSLEHVWHSFPSHQVRKFHSRNSSQLLAFHQQFVDFVIRLLDTCMPRPLHRMGRGEKGKRMWEQTPLTAIMRPYEPHHRKPGPTIHVSASDMGHWAVKRLSSRHFSVWGNLRAVRPRSRLIPSEPWTIHQNHLCKEV